MVAAPADKSKTEVAAAKEVEKMQPSAEDLKKSSDAKPAEEAKQMESEASNFKDLSAEEVSSKLAKAVEKLSAGKKALLQNQPQQAVDHLADACALQSSVKGDMSFTMCEYYFHYGRALLELARIEEDVLGNALSGVPDGDDLENSQVENPEKMTEEEKDTVAQQVDEALEENFKKVEGLKNGEAKVEAMDEGGEGKGDDASKEKVEDKAEKKVEVKSEKEEVEVKSEKEKKVEVKSEEEEKVEDKSEKEAKVEEVEDKKDTKEEKMTIEAKAEESEEKSKSSEATAVNGSTKDDKESDEAADGEVGSEDEEVEGEEDAEEEAAADGEEVSQEGSQEDEEEVSSLQLAWEVLELAKTIYENQETRPDEDLMKQAQVFLKLGEVCLENENYPESIKMYRECLTLQDKVLDPDDRCLAETHYQLGLAYSFADNFDEAVQQLHAAISVIETRITNIKLSLKKEKIELTDDMDLTALSEDSKSQVSDVRELEKLLPELQDKVTDIKDTKASFTEKLKAMKAHFTGQLGGTISGKTVFDEGASTSSASAFEQPEGAESSKDVKPIATSLIRKKRKPDEQAQSAEVAKKPRIEEPAAEKAAEDKPKSEKSSDKKKDEAEAKTESKKAESPKKEPKEEKKEDSEEKMDVQESEDKKSES